MYRNKNTSKYIRAASIALAILTVAVALLFIIQVLDIYLSGISPANQPSPGVYLEQIYSAETIGLHFSRIAPLVYLWFAACVAMIFVRVIFPAPKENIDTESIKKWRMQELAKTEKKEIKKRLTPQIIVCTGLAISVVLIIWGICNGGMRDVFVKAVNICTECVGLG